MKRILIIVICSIAISSSGVWAQHTSVPDANAPGINNYPLHVSDQLNNSEFLKKLLQKNEENPGMRKSMAAADEVGDERDFFVYNFTSESFNTVLFRLMKKGEVSQVWFEVAEINNGHLNETVADSIFKYLEEESNQYSFDPNRGIIELSNEYLGDPPNYDGDGLADFLITDIQDGWNPDDGGGYTAGFFYSVDQFPDDDSEEPDYRSNERDVLYIDSYPGIYNNDAADPIRPLGVLSHEYQHLIHYKYNSGIFSEITFINEAQSNFASLLAGYFPHSSYSRYLGNTNVPLFGWRSGNDVLEDYGRAASFSSYMWDQLGFENSGALTQNPQSGRLGVNSTFISLDAPFTFEEFLVNWGIANLLNDKELNEFYGYEHPFLTNLKVSVDFENPEISSRTIGVENGGIEYLGFRQSKNFEITVSAENTATDEIRVLTEDDDGTIEIQILNSGETFSTPDEKLYEQVYIMLVNTETSGEEPHDFNVSVSGEQTYNLSTFSTYGETEKFYWPVPYENTSGVGRHGFSNKFTVQFDALLHSLELYIVTGQGSDGEQIGVKGEGTLRMAAYTDEGGVPGQALASDSVSFSEIGAGWQSFNVTSWDLELEEGEVIHVVYELIVPTLDQEINSIPLRLDDGNGTQNVTHVLIAPEEFEVMFSDDVSGGQHGVWNNLVLAEAIVTDIEETGSSQPEVFQLSQNYPNPFNPTTNINFNLPVAAEVELTIYNALGQKVTALVNSSMPAGSHTVTWDAKNLASGLYIYKIKAGDFIKTKKMILMK